MRMPWVWLPLVVAVATWTGPRAGADEPTTRPQCTDRGDVHRTDDSSGSAVETVERGLRVAGCATTHVVVTAGEATTKAAVTAGEATTRAAVTAGEATEKAVRVSGRAIRDGVKWLGRRINGGG